MKQCPIFTCKSKKGCVRVQKQYSHLPFALQQISLNVFQGKGSFLPSLNTNRNTTLIFVSDWIRKKPNQDIWVILLDAIAYSANPVVKYFEGKWLKDRARNGRLGRL